MATLAAPDPVRSPSEAYRYMHRRRQVIIDSARQRPLIRLWDKDMKFIGVVAAEQKLDAEEMIHAAGQGSITLLANDWLTEFITRDVRAEEDLHITIDPNPTKRSWRTRWGGKVESVNIKRTADGIHLVELQLIHNRKHLEHILLGANPFFPPEVQQPKMWLLPGNTRTICATTLFVNLARQYMPGFNIITNIANPAVWLGTKLTNISPLDWPVQVAFVNPFLDQSRLSFVTSRWTDAHSVFDPILKDAGCIIRAYTWLTEDEDSPHTELSELLGNNILTRPTRNCVVLAVEDKSGVTGPTGTAIDGVINLVGSLADDMITETIIPVDADHDGKTDPLFRKWLKVAPAPPKVIFRDTEHSAIIDAVRAVHKAKARTIMTGSKSPAIVNQLQTFGIKYALSELSALISQGPFAAQVPGTPGLEELYQGQLDNSLLAYQRFTDIKRVFQMGTHAFLEHWEAESGSAYTVSGIKSLRDGHWKTRPYTSFKTNVVNGYPWLVHYDFTLGDRLGFELVDVIHADQCSAIRMAYDETTPLQYGLSIGMDGEEEDPAAKGMRTLQAAWSVVGMLMGSGDEF
ncbi:hypothetical protein OE265_07560 [Mycobacteroides abscessus]|uniref:Gp37-like protein n=1 Tax=Mycobacteroides abscessus TaxID=36809 RepID=UPI0021D7C481|nr:hypothetical protein [Mycobacteroides abscessus]MCU8690152.1 hypothetical protein [Mycobacteroides abscessus]MCU8709361.1 hypothetical protein [Mycobacteroides abscessus]MCU8714059.1 hypothetical protein [Mycobacteroides abscessus]MCU8748121.1 hypothetical protein [Mycobacteroides abscessus]MCU8758908.1 hypothetical protein [Mycobacteroides abscessus]